MKILPHWSMRSNIIALVIAAVVPLALFAGALIQYSFQVQQAIIDDSLRTTVRATLASLDREFTSSIQALQVLGSSKALDRGSVPFFPRHARGVAWQSQVTGP